MDRQFVAQEMAALSGFDRINVTDDIGNGHIRGSKFLDKSGIAPHPIDVCQIAMNLCHVAAVCGNWMEGIVVNFRAGDDGDALVEQIRKLADDAALRLSAQTE